MESIANKLVYGFTTKQAQDWICNRLNVLKLQKEIPEKWQRACHKSPESTTTERYTLEDIELQVARKWEVGNQCPDIRQRQSECSRHVQTRGPDCMDCPAC